MAVKSWGGTELYATPTIRLQYKAGNRFVESHITCIPGMISWFDNTSRYVFDNACFGDPVCEAKYGGEAIDLKPFPKVESEDIAGVAFVAAQLAHGPEQQPIQAGSPGRGLPCSPRRGPGTPPCHAARWVLPGVQASVPFHGIWDPFRRTP